MYRSALILAFVGVAWAAEPRPNLLLVVIDTLRADHLGCYGYTRQTTPTLDALAASGVRFERCIASSSWTIPSLMTFFTGVAPSVHGATTFQRRLRPGIATLAETLAASGYLTAGFTANPAAHSRFGFAQGFSRYDDFSVQFAAEDEIFGDQAQRPSVHSVPTGHMVTRLARQWLTDRPHDTPFFLSVHYLDPHVDYAPPPPYQKRFVDPAYTGSEDGHAFESRAKTMVDPADRQQVVALYDGEVAWVDHCVADLLAGLSAAGIDERTLVVVVADHGEEFWDHGATLHGHTLFEELVHVPLLMRWPGRLPAGRNVPGLFAGQDLMPTLLAGLGVATPASCRGIDFWPSVIGDKGAPVRDEAICETEVDGDHLLAVRGLRWKTIWNRTRERWTAYDLVADPSELAPLSEPWPEDCVRQRDHLRGWWASLPPAADAGPAPVLDAAERERLRALGYLH